MRYRIQTQQPANIVQEFQIEAEGEYEAQEIIQIMISNGELPEPIYSATEVCGRAEIFSVEVE
jgi:endonuclease V-like protein UPF0215 family